MSIESLMPSNHLNLCCPLLLPSVSQHQGLFQWVSSLHQVAKVLSFSFSISPSSEYLGLISFRIDWLDLPAVQGTLKSLLQHRSLKALILQHSTFFMVQLSHPYMTTGKTLALIIRIFISKVISLIFNMLSGFVIAFLPRSKRLLNSRLQSLSTMILEPKKVKSVTEGEIHHWGERKAGLKLSSQKTKIMTSGPVTSWQIGGEKMTVTDFIFYTEVICALRIWERKWSLGDKSLDLCSRNIWGQMVYKAANTLVSDGFFTVSEPWLSHL